MDEEGKTQDADRLQTLIREKCSIVDSPDYVFPATLPNVDVVVWLVLAAISLVITAAGYLF